LWCSFSTITQLKNSLTSKQTVIELLNSEKREVAQQTAPLMKEVENLTEQLVVSAVLFFGVLLIYSFCLSFTVASFT